MEQFISDPLKPLPGGFDTAPMARGEPGLPAGFTWRGESLRIEQVLETWKASSREGGRATGELYLRRHYWRLKMSDGATWVVYFTRQTPKSGKPTRRWFLYSVDAGEESRE